MQDYAAYATHFMSSRDLYLRDCVFKDGKLVMAEVVNGAWILKRNDDDWNACNFYNHVVTVMPIQPEDDVLEVINREKLDEEKQNCYNPWDDDIPF